MKTIEILEAITKDQPFAVITQKQRDWLFHQAKREGFLRSKPKFFSIMLEAKYYNVKEITGTPGRFEIRRMYAFKVDGSSASIVGTDGDLVQLKAMGKPFRIVKPATVLK